MIPGRREPNKMSQMIAPTYWLEKLSKLQCRKQEPSQKNKKQKTQRIPSSGDSAESRKTKVLEFAEQSVREVIAAWRTLEFLRHC